MPTIQGESIELLYRDRPPSSRAAASRGSTRAGERTGNTPACLPVRPATASLDGRTTDITTVEQYASVVPSPYESKNSGGELEVTIEAPMEVVSSVKRDKEHGMDPAGDDCAPCAEVGSPARVVVTPPRVFR